MPAEVLPDAKNRERSALVEEDTGAEPIFAETWLGMTQPATSHIAEHIQLFEENTISLL
jgi:hypothetical protein